MGTKAAQRPALGAMLAATAGAPDVAVACLTLLATGAAAFSFVTLCSTTLQLHSSPEFRGRIMALWVYVYIGTSPVGSIITGAIISAAGPRAALLTGAAACLVAAAIASRVHTPPHPDAALTDLATAPSLPLAGISSPDSIRRSWWFSCRRSWLRSLSWCANAGS